MTMRTRAVRFFAFVSLHCSRCRLQDCVCVCAEEAMTNCRPITSEVLCINFCGSSVARVRRASLAGGWLAKWPADQRTIRTHFGEKSTASRRAPPHVAHHECEHWKGINATVASVFRTLIRYSGEHALLQHTHTINRCQL